MNTVKGGISLLFFPPFIRKKSREKSLHQECYSLLYLSPFPRSIFSPSFLLAAPLFQFYVFRRWVFKRLCRPRDAMMRSRAEISPMRISELITNEKDSTRDEKRGKRLTRA